MLNIWLNIKNNAPGRESKIGDCHAAAYVFLRLWYKFEVKNFPSFCQIYFSRIICVPEFDRTMLIARKVNMTF